MLLGEPFLLSIDAPYLWRFVYKRSTATSWCAYLRGGDLDGGRELYFNLLCAEEVFNPTRKWVVGLRIHNRKIFFLLTDES